MSSIFTWTVLIFMAALVALFLVGYFAALADQRDGRKPRGVPPRVLILGYHPRLKGGVTSVTTTLLRYLPEARLFSIQHGYGPKSWGLYVLSLLRLPFALGLRRPLVAHLIVASKGDRARGVIPILLCKLFGVPVLAHYHTNRANMQLA
jgi:hypothetical protein